MTPEAWDQVTWATEKPIDVFLGKIHELPLVDVDEESSYLAAWKKVGPGEKLPDHYLKIGSDESFGSRLKQRFRRRDLGLMIEYDWEETLTDVVTLEGMRTARDEAVELYLELLEPTLQRSLGEEYDISELMTWFRNEGSAIFADLTDTMYDFARSELRTIERNTYEAKFQQRIEGILKAHGLAGLFDDNGKLQEPEALHLVTNLVQNKIKRHDGETVSPDVVTDLLDAFGGEGSKKKSALRRKLQQEWKLAIRSRPGGQDAVDKRLRNLLTRIHGVHGQILTISSQRFQYTMTVPGFLIETNGRVLGVDRVQWTFHEIDAWPSGYAMRCRSLLDQTEMIPELSAWQKAHGRELLPRLAELVSDHPKLIDTLKNCRSAGTLSPLKDLFNITADNDLAEVTGKVLRLLTTVPGQR